jgi:hypothetical protein
MEGRIGGLFKDGNQIGGFTDWKFGLLLADTPYDKEKYKFAKWKLESPAYWLFAEPDDFVARLYHDIGDSYWEGSGKVISKIQNVFDTMIHERIEIIGEGTLSEHRASSLSS